jgi:hypothetical protein
VLPYTHDQLGITNPFRLWAGRILLLLVGSLVFVVAVNLAILVYARTVTRLGEIAVRTALGASRRRLLAQLFIEALVLAVVGAGAGLMPRMWLQSHAIPGCIERERAVLDHPELSIGTVIYAIGLTVLAAAIIGVLPGLGPPVAACTPTCANGMVVPGTGRYGPRSSSRKSPAVAVLLMAVYMACRSCGWRCKPGFAAEEFAVGIVALSYEPAAIVVNRLRHGSSSDGAPELQPGVSAVTLSSGVRGCAGPPASS